MVLALYQPYKGDGESSFHCCKLLWNLYQSNHKTFCIRIENIEEPRRVLLKENVESSNFRNITCLNEELFVFSFPTGLHTDPVLAFHIWNVERFTEVPPLYRTIRTTSHINCFAVSKICHGRCINVTVHPHKKSNARILKNIASERSTSTKHFCSNVRHTENLKKGILGRLQWWR